MAKAQILLCPDSLMAQFVFGRDRKEDVARANLDQYHALPPIDCAQDGVDAAEEMFDLTNNPCRQDEREAKYGRGRSLSVGDIVRVGANDWLCGSIGWIQL